MRGNRWHSPRIRWYPAVMRPGARWLVRLTRGTEAAEQRPTGVSPYYHVGVRVWDTNGLGAFRSLRELTAREPLTRMARTGMDSDGPCAQGTYRYRIFLEKHRIFLKTLNPNKKTQNPKP